MNSINSQQPNWVNQAQQLTPQKYYPITKDFKIKFTPSIKKQKDSIYVFKNITNNKRYNGLTTQKVTTRWSQHLSVAGKVKKGIKIGTKFHQALSLHPDQFKVGIYSINDSKTTLGEKENIIINAKDSVNNGYNSINGAKNLGKSSASKKLF